MHERKAEMARFADAFIALPGIYIYTHTTSLPSFILKLTFQKLIMCVLFFRIELAGGYGTLEELLEIITWAQLGIHKKPVKSKLSFIRSSCF